MLVSMHMAHKEGVFTTGFLSMFDILILYVHHVHYFHTIKRIEIEISNQLIQENRIFPWPDVIMGGP